MKINTLKTIQKDELSKFGQLPDWINPLMQPLNNFISSVGSAIRGKLTFEDNFQCIVKTLEITSGVSQKINPNSSLRVVGIIPTSGGGLIIDKFGWVQNADGTINVTINFVTGTSAKNCKIILLMG